MALNVRTHEVERRSSNSNHRLATTFELAHNRHVPLVFFPSDLPHVAVLAFQAQLATRLVLIRSETKWRQNLEPGACVTCSVRHIPQVQGELACDTCGQIITVGGKLYRVHLCHMGTVFLFAATTVSRDLLDFVGQRSRLLAVFRIHLFNDSLSHHFCPHVISASREETLEERTFSV